jgi:hypothetical protein
MIEQAFALVLAFNTAQQYGTYSVTVMPSEKACAAVQAELYKQKKDIVAYGRFSASCVPLTKD